MDDQRFFDWFCKYNAPLPLEKFDKALIAEASQLYWLKPYSNELAGKVIPVKYYASIFMRAGKCRGSVINCNVFGKFLHDRLVGIRSNGLHSSGREEKWRKVEGMEETEDFIEYSVVKERFVKEFTYALDSITALWDYLARAIKEHYKVEIPDNECNMRSVILDQKVRGRQEKLWKHCFSGDESPYRKIKAMRNASAHESDWVGVMKSNLFTMLSDDADFVRWEDRSEEEVKNLTGGYIHFMEGYVMMLTEMARQKGIEVTGVALKGKDPFK